MCTTTSHVDVTTIPAGGMYDTSSGHNKNCNWLGLTRLTGQNTLTLAMGVSDQLYVGEHRERVIDYSQIN